MISFINSYLTVNSLLNKYPSDFRSTHSTMTTLLGVTNQWYFNIDNGSVTPMVFLGLAKAFDKIDHDIFMETLWLFGFELDDNRDMK